MTLPSETSLDPSAFGVRMTVQGGGLGAGGRAKPRKGGHDNEVIFLCTFLGVWADRFSCRLAVR